jgi:hypothetical protein
MATRLEIRTRARIRADQDNSTFPTDTQYNYLIDEAAKEVWYDLIKAGWPISFSSVLTTWSVSFTTLSGLSITDPVAFIRGVYYVSGTTYVELKRLNEGDRGSLMSATGVSQPSHYDVRVDAANGIGVEVLPYVAGASIRIEYVKEHPGLPNDASVWYGPARSDELIVLKAAIKGCRKEGNDQGARFLEGEYAYLLECVQDMASWTNMRHAATIRDLGNPLGVERLPGDFDLY